MSTKFKKYCEIPVVYVIDTDKVGLNKGDKIEVETDNGEILSCVIYKRVFGGEFKSLYSFTLESGGTPYIDGEKADKLMSKPYSLELLKNQWANWAALESIYSLAGAKTERIKETIKYQLEIAMTLWDLEHDHEKYVKEKRKTEKMLISLREQYSLPN